MDNKWKQQKSYVIVEGEFIPTDIVEFINIEEDISGRDLMTFVYQYQERKSYVVVR